MKTAAGAFLAMLVTMPCSAAPGDLRLSIANGRVTLVAQDVTIKQILDEWSRVGQTTIVGAERLMGTPVTIELTDVAEGRALESLLRSASGYIAKPRAGTPGASTYDRILIMPASRRPPCQQRRRHSPTGHSRRSSCRTSSTTTSRTRYCRRAQRCRRSRSSPVSRR